MKRITNTVMHPGLVLAAVLSIALLQSPPTLAIQRDHFPAPSDYAVKVPDKNGKPSYFDVPATRGEIFVCYEFKQIKNWQRPPDQSTDALAYQLKCRREGDTIRIDLSVVFGLPGRSNSLGIARTLPPEGLPGQLIGSYSARLGETLNLQELASFGIEPISITVVSSRSRTLDPSEIGNETKAIQVVGAYKARDNYQLELKNISSKDIIALSVRGGLTQVSHAGSIIAPGQVDTLGFADHGWRPLQDQRLGEQGPKLVVADVVFADLTFEGQKEFAIRVAATRRGARTQWARVVPLLQAALEGLQRDSERALNSLRQQISALDEDVESSVVDQLARFFLPLTEKQRGSLTYQLKDSLKSEKGALLSLITYYVAEEAVTGTSRESWLKHVTEIYEALLKRALK